MKKKTFVKITTFTLATLAAVFVSCTNKAPVKVNTYEGMPTEAENDAATVDVESNIKAHMEEINALWEMTVGKGKKFAKYATADKFVVLSTEDDKNYLLLSFYNDIKGAENLDGIAIKEGQDVSFQGSALVVRDNNKTTYYDKSEYEGFNQLFTVTEKDGKKTYTNDLGKPYQEKDALAFMEIINKQTVKPLAEIMGEWKGL